VLVRVSVANMKYFHKWHSNYTNNVNNEIAKGSEAREFCTPGPNSWTSTCQVWPLAPIYQIKRYDEE
jgi:hypothetical protein